MPGQPKIYPNLNPAAAIPVDRAQIFRLESFFDQYRLHKASQHGQYVPNYRYIFVKMASGETLMHPTYRHPAIAEGRPVHYAGEAYFDNGRLLWWSNGSGNYRPDADHAEQARLPLDRFYTFDEILKGVHQNRPAQRESGSLQPKMRHTVGQDGILRAIGNRAGPLFTPTRADYQSARRSPTCPTVGISTPLTWPPPYRPSILHGARR